MTVNGSGRAEAGPAIRSAPVGPPPAIPGLEQLLAALQSEGFAIGSIELTRIHHALGVLPDVTLNDVRRLLKNVLVKDSLKAEDFDAEFSHWCEQADLAFEAQLALAEVERGTRSSNHADGSAGPSDKRDSLGDESLDSQFDQSLDAGNEGEESAPDSAASITEQGKQVAHRASAALTDRARTIGWLFGLLLVVAASIIGWLHPDDQTTVVESPLQPTTGTHSSGTTSTVTNTPAWSAQYSDWRFDRVAVTSHEPIFSRSLLAVIVLGCLGGAFILWLLEARRRRSLPIQFVRGSGVGWRPLPLEHGGEARLLLPSKALKTAVWAVEHFVSEEPTRDLDVPRTVHATSRAAGIFQLHHQRAKYPRSVWLWVDADCLTPTHRCYLDELQSGLRLAGLPVRQAQFWGNPRSMEWLDGETFSPLTVEGQREEVWLFIVTDGAGIRAALDSDLEASSTLSVLKGVAQWPRVRVVDLGGERLGDTLKPLGLTSIRLKDIPRILGSSGGQIVVADEVVSTSVPIRGELATWSAGLALGDARPRLDLALALHRQMQLSVSAWSYHHIVDEFKQLRLGETELIRLVNDLAARSEPALGGGANDESSNDSSDDEDHIGLGHLVTHSSTDTSRAALGRYVAPDSSLALALTFWRDRSVSAQADAAREANAVAGAWTDTPADLNHRLNIALLDLWDQPNRALIELERLDQFSTFSETVHARLQGYQCRDAAAATGRIGDEDHETSGPLRLSATHFALPWSVADLDDDSVARLAVQFGLGGQLQESEAPTKRSGALGAAIGLLLGISAVSGVKYFVPPEATVPYPSDSRFTEAPFKDHLIHERLNDDYVLIGTPKHVQKMRAGRTERVAVHWLPIEASTTAIGSDPKGSQPTPSSGWMTTLASQEDTGDNTGVIRMAGRLGNPIRPCDSRWPRRSFVIIDVAHRDVAMPIVSEAKGRQDVLARADWAAANRLATVLLDTGSADRVLIGRPTAQNLAKATQGIDTLGDRDQIIVFTGRRPQKQRLFDFVQAFTPRSGVLVVDGFKGLSAPDAFDKLALAIANMEGVQAPQVYSSTEGDWLARPNIYLHGLPKAGEDKASSLRFATVCGGTFTMGSNNDAKDEKASHAVALPQFEVATTEVSNAQYRRYDSNWNNSKDDLAKDNRPANVSWNEASAYCKSIDARLPTEAEWEYAARGGTTTRWSFGDNEANLNLFAWNASNAENGIHAVGALSTNPLGLFDVHGNVWEWVDDCYDPGVYGRRASIEISPRVGPHACPEVLTSTLVDGTVQLVHANARGLRGGSAFNESGDLRSSARSWNVPWIRNKIIGFRCARFRRQP